MSRRYLDIDEILAEDERVTCKTLQESAYLGHLNSDLNVADLPRDSIVDVPLWLAQVFFEVCYLLLLHYIKFMGSFTIKTFSYFRYIYQTAHIYYRKI
jgi:hypothetical protein